MTVENGGGGGGVEAPVERMRVERTVWENEKKRKENEWNEWAGQREQMVSVKMSGGEWWVVGLGGGTHGPQKCWLLFIYFYFLKLMGCYMFSLMNEVNPCVASALCFIWDAKPIFTIIGIRANFNIMLV